MSARALAASVAPGHLQRASALTDFSGSRDIAVSEEIGSLLPWPRLRRGATICLAAKAASGTTSLLLALMAQLSRSGAWCALIGASSVSAVAAQQAGVSLSRLAFVETAERDRETAAGALLNGIDLVAVHITSEVPSQMPRRLMAKARKRGNILVPFGPGAQSWPNTDVSWSVEKTTWHGLNRGRGMLRHCELHVRARMHGRDRYGTVWPYSRAPGVAETRDVHGRRTASVTSLPSRKVKALRSG